MFWVNKLILQMVVVIVLLILIGSNVNALTFDNRIRDYDEGTKTIIIDDNFGLGGDFGVVDVATLNTPLSTGIKHYEFVRNSLTSMTWNFYSITQNRKAVARYATELSKERPGSPV